LCKQLDWTEDSVCKEACKLVQLYVAACSVRKCWKSNKKIAIFIKKIVLIKQLSIDGMPPHVGKVLLRGCSCKDAARVWSNSNSAENFAFSKRRARVGIEFIFYIFSLLWTFRLAYHFLFWFGYRFAFTIISCAPELSWFIIFKHLIFHIIILQQVYLLS